MLPPMRSMPVILRRTSDRNDQFRFRMEALIPARSPGPRLQLLHATLVDNLLDMNFHLFGPVYISRPCSLGCVLSSEIPLSSDQFSSAQDLALMFNVRSTSARDQ